MFKAPIISTPLTSNEAQTYFDNRINGGVWRGDVSLLATLRALIDSRLGDGESLSINMNSSSYSADQLAGLTPDYVMDAVFSDVRDRYNTMFVHMFVHADQKCNDAWMEMVKSNFERHRDGWHRVEKVTDFFRKSFYVLCFVNPESKNVAIFTENLNFRQYHYLQCGIPAYFPWYFQSEDNNITVSEKEMDLIDSLRQKTEGKYLCCIEEIAEKYDFKTARVRQLLAGFESRYERIRCDRIKQDIESCRYNIDDFNTRIGEYLQQQRDLEIQLLGIEAKIQQTGDESEIMEYFLCNKHLSLESVSNTTMKFVVKDYLTYFDEDMAQRIIDNKTSYIYLPQRNVNEEARAAMGRLMRAVFLDQKIKIRVCAAYQFILEGNVEAIANYNYGAEYREYMPNPHINEYRCMGNYGRTINELLKNRNYIGAIEQCIASCKSLNFADSPVMNAFMANLYGYGRYAAQTKCFELPDGRVVTPHEAMTYLDEEGANNG